MVQDSFAIMNQQNILVYADFSVEIQQQGIGHPLENVPCHVPEFISRLSSVT